MSDIVDDASSGRRDQDSPSDTTQAWQAIGVLTGWIQHAEAKTAGILAAASVLGGPLLRYATDHRPPSTAATTAAVLCGIAALLSAICCVLALLPSISLQRGRKSDDILLIPPTEAFSAAGATGAEVAILAGDSRRLTEYLATQVLANSAVARRKSFWANCALLALLVGVVAFILLSLLAGIWI
ncbi:hypothetical protein H7K45_08660 [Mycobacterium yunnanensis]|uniref:Pycsar effector protein domain-containing protein n=1 Tax=Mycobacterium yunnanensis TaxID=368477 RepID=A0A9X2Z0A5_9MYCO|nr:Pycsar system effector family protein [Mycobacterium yunnanensis]MCV7420609.1 hypothetical protein [Mycobacterium yunnanensis]